ncbi:hypothetical protein J6TS2_37020 [Heyndrickxia sporothermodurans]|nr:hypothetical protein J6TS2_37020 [Heyndrickxia sporothermodurans]
MSAIYNISLISLILLSLGQLVLIFFLARYIGNFIRKIESINGIEIGTLQIDQIAPAFRENDHNGDKIISNEILSTNNTLLLFINTNCPTCKSLLPELHRIKKKYSINLILVNTDEQHEDNSIVNHLNEEIIYIRSNKLMRLYSITTVPYGILINEDKTIQQISELKNSNGLWNMLLNVERKAS